MTRSRWTRRDVLAMAAIAVAVLIANSPALLHVVTTNPLRIDAFLGPPPVGWLPGTPVIDGNAGFTAQALGHLVALDWLHGHVPWWNPFEGIGSPLAGEMQSGAFFPLTLLLVFDRGLMMEELALELIAGWATFALARRLGTGRTFAAAGGASFALCGTFAWFAHAPMRPVAFLPLALVGVERAIGAAKEQRRGGWVLLALAFALGILAGFPETTLLDALFTAWWALSRVVSEARRGRRSTDWRQALAAARKLAAGAAGGIALAAPLVWAFLDYLPSADIGAHAGDLSDIALPSSGIAQVLLPYSLGPIFGLTSPASGHGAITITWGSVGGYVGMAVATTAIMGLFGRRHRLLRFGLVVWISVAVARTYGVGAVVRVMAAVPGLGSIAIYRYATPSWELAAIILGVLGLDDVVRGLVGRWVPLVAVLTALLLGAWSAVVAWSVTTGAASTPGKHPIAPHDYVSLSIAEGASAACALALLAWWAARRRDQELHRSAWWPGVARGAAAAVLAGEAGLLLLAPSFSAPRPSPPELGAVTWLQTHLGTERFYTLGPIQPDYGSFFGIAETDTNDLPEPKAWSQYVPEHLDPNANPLSFTGGARVDPAGPTPAEELASHLAGFETIGVGYVVEPADGKDVQGQSFPRPGTPPWPVGPRLVYRDDLAEIWQLPHPAPLYSLEGNPAGCTVTTSRWSTATVRCDRPTVLVRREQALPGWSAAIAGRATPVGTYRRGPPGLFQDVLVPTGDHTVTFAYLPPDEPAAIIVALLAALWMAASWWRGARSW